MILLAIWLRIALHVASVEPEIDPILVENVRLMAPHLDEQAAKAHVNAATAAARLTDLPPQLLLGMARVESSFEPRWVSHVNVIGERVTKPWRSIRRLGTGPRFCGALQAAAGRSWLACLMLRDLDIGYLAGALELRQWLRYAHGDVRRALNGHGCGVRGMREGCRFYGRRVLTRARRLAVRSPST